MDGYQILGLTLVMFSLGTFAGHAAGYIRAESVARKRAAAALTGGPRYQRERVGAPE